MPQGGEALPRRFGENITPPTPPSSRCSVDFRRQAGKGPSHSCTFIILVACGTLLASSVRTHRPEPLCVRVFSFVVGVHYFFPCEASVKDNEKRRREARVKWLDARRSENFAAFHAAATRRPNKTTPTSKMAQRGQQITAHQDTQQERSTDVTRWGFYAVANIEPEMYLAPPKQ